MTTHDALVKEGSPDIFPAAYDPIFEFPIKPALRGTQGPAVAVSVDSELCCNASAVSTISSAQDSGYRSRSPTPLRQLVNTTRSNTCVDHYHCKFCERQFNRPDNYRRHLRTHACNRISRLQDPRPSRITKDFSTKSQINQPLHWRANITGSGSGGLNSRPVSSYEARRNCPSTNHMPTPSIPGNSSPSRQGNIYPSSSFGKVLLDPYKTAEVDQRSCEETSTSSSANDAVLTHFATIPAHTKNLHKIDDKTSTKHLLYTYTANIGVKNELPQSSADSTPGLVQSEGTNPARSPIDSQRSRGASADTSTQSSQSSRSGSEQTQDCSGAASESDVSQELSLEQDSRLALLHFKHELFIRLMQEVYALFDQRWKPHIRSHVTKTSNTNPGPSQASQSHGKGGAYKRQRNDRDPPPPDDRSKRRRDDAKRSSKPEENHLFACPFHKYDRTKYRCSVANGSRYRACVGPGFGSISRIK